MLEARKLISVGTHVYCGATGSCSVISDEPRNYGIPYKLYIAALQGNHQVIDPPADVEHSSNMKFFIVTNNTLLRHSIGNTTTESFFDILSSALRLGGPMAATSGGPLGAIAGMGLSALGNLVPSGQDCVRFEFTGIMERNILQEAAFQAIQCMNSQIRRNLGMDEEMARISPQLFLTVKPLTPFLHNIILEPSINIASYMTLKQSKPTFKSNGEFPHRKPFQDSEFANFPIQDPETREAFIQALMSPKIPAGGAEAIYDGLGPLIQKGLRCARPLSGSAAERALEVLASTVEHESEDKRPRFLDSLEGATERAVMGQVALQVVQKIRVQRLQEEGFFDTMKSFVQKIGGPVMKSGPAVTEGLKSLLESQKKVCCVNFSKWW